MCMYIGVGCVECSLKNGDEAEDALGKVGRQTHPTKGRETERAGLGRLGWLRQGNVRHPLTIDRPRCPIVICRRCK